MYIIIKKNVCIAFSKYLWIYKLNGLMFFVIQTLL